MKYIKTFKVIQEYWEGTTIHINDGNELIAPYITDIVYVL